MKNHLFGMSRSEFWQKTNNPKNGLKTPHYDWMCQNTGKGSKVA